MYNNRPAHLNGVWSEELVSRPAARVEYLSASLVEERAERDVGLCELRHWKRARVELHHVDTPLCQRLRVHLHIELRTRVLLTRPRPDVQVDAQLQSARVHLEGSNEWSLDSAHWRGDRVYFEKANIFAL